MQFEIIILFTWLAVLAATLISACVSIGWFLP